MRYLEERMECDETGMRLQFEEGKVWTRGWLRWMNLYHHGNKVGYTLWVSYLNAEGPFLLHLIYVVLRDQSFCVSGS